MSDGYKMFQEGYSKGFEDGVANKVACNFEAISIYMQSIIEILKEQEKDITDTRYEELEKCYNKLVDKVIGK